MDMLNLGTANEELGIFHVIFEFCNTLVLQNVEITWEIPSYAKGHDFINFLNTRTGYTYRKRRYKCPGRLLGTLLGEEGGWAFIKAIFLMNQF